MSTRPNVLLVVMDTTRADHLSCYGYDRPTTPNIDKFASEGVIFENAIAPAAWTLPSHASLFTGLLPSEHGVLHGEYDLDGEIPMITEHLSAAGYDTAAFSNNPWVSPSYDFDRGFDTFVEVFREHVHKYKSGVERNVARLKKAFLMDDTGAASTNEAVKEWFRQRSNDDPFFTFINYMEPHQVYAPRRPYHREYLDGGLLDPYRKVLKNRRLHRNRGKIFSGERPLHEDEIADMKALYDGEISYLDQQIGELLGWLRNRGELDDTLVLLMGDHGEEFGDHSPFGPQLVDHHFGLYDPIVRVPLIARLPEVFDDGRESTPVQLTDVAPTLDDLVEPFEYEPDGLSSHSLLDLPDERIACSEYVSPPPQLESLENHAPSFDWSTYDVDLRMVRSRQEKLVQYRNKDRSELYDLTTDPEEQNDLSDQVTPSDQLVSRLDEWGETAPVKGRPNSGDHDDAVRDHLEDLGYL